MTWIEMGLIAQLIVSLYLAHKVGKLQDELEDTQAVVGSILMDMANDKTP